MATTPATTQRAARRAHGEDSIWYDAAKKTYVGAISLGFTADGRRNRPKVYGKTKTEVREKIRARRKELEAGLEKPAAKYTVRNAVEDWLQNGLSGRSERTVTLYRDGVQPLMNKIGAKPLRKLTAGEVRSALNGLTDQLSTRSLEIAHNCLTRAITMAEADDLVGRNVSALVETPEGREGRRSKAFTVKQAQDLLQAAAGMPSKDGAVEPHRLYAYVVLLLTTGLRPEEARALRWDHIDLDARTVAVWRSDRAGGDTKTPKSKRTLKLAQLAVTALRQRQAVQDADRQVAREVWTDNGLVFTTTLGTMLDQHNIRRGFRQITRAAGLGVNWVPRELRHTFVSILSAGGVPVEEIARIVGHKQTNTTELVYRKELRPVITTGAEIMDTIFTA